MIAPHFMIFLAFSTSLYMEFSLSLFKFFSRTSCTSMSLTSYFEIVCLVTFNSAPSSSWDSPLLFLKEINFSLKFISCTPFCFCGGLIITKSRSNILPIRVGNLSTANNICPKECTSVKISLVAYCHNKNWGKVGWYLSIFVCCLMAHEHLWEKCQKASRW